MVQIGSMAALQRARKDARVDPEVDCEAREGSRIDRPGGVIRRMRTQSHSRDSATRRRSEGWCRAAAAPSLLAGERGEHAEHAEACKPGEGTARLPTDFARILFTLPARGFAHKAPPGRAFCAKYRLFVQAISGRRRCRIAL